MTHLVVPTDVVTPEHWEGRGGPAGIASAYAGPPFLVPESRTRVTWVFTDVDEVMAILRRDQPAAEPKPEAAA